MSDKIKKEIDEIKERLSREDDPRLARFYIDELKRLRLIEGTERT